MIFLCAGTVGGATQRGADWEAPDYFQMCGRERGHCRALSCARVGERADFAVRDVGVGCGEAAGACRDGESSCLVPCPQLTRALPVCLLRAGVREEAAHGADLRHLDAL